MRPSTGFLASLLLGLTAFFPSSIAAPVDPSAKHDIVRRHWSPPNHFPLPSSYPTHPWPTGSGIVGPTRTGSPTGFSSSIRIPHSTGTTTTSASISKQTGGGGFGGSSSPASSSVSKQTGGGGFGGSSSSSAPAGPASASVSASASAPASASASSSFAPLQSSSSTAPPGPAKTSAACVHNGKLICNGRYEWGLCNFHQVFFQPVALGTACVKGKIVFA